MALGLGKVIVLGEHAVVYGHSALAGALDRGVEVFARSGTFGLSIPEWSLNVDADADHPVAHALMEVAERLEIRPRVRLEGTASIPPGAGLGSSAALAVASVRALAAAMRRDIGDDEVAAIAHSAERVFHQRPSGVDTQLATHGGLGMFRVASGFASMPGVRLSVAIAITGEPRSTAHMVARVAAITEGRADDPRLVRLGELADRGAAALRDGDLAGLGIDLDVAQGLLAELGVSSPGIERLIGIAREYGALGAKLTGAGGGGAVIAIAPGREEQIVGAWRAAGYESFSAVLG